MLTRCPACNTRFRLHPVQLRVAGGQVRCGRCGHLFDANRPAAIPATIQAIPETAATPPGAAPRRGSGPVAVFFWFFGVLALSAALLLQYIWWERHTLIADPLGRQILQQVCRYAPCDVEPPRAPDKLTVLQRNLTPDPERPDLLRFQMRLVNRADHPQPFPLIELRLFGDRQGLIAVDRFEPARYRGDSTSGWDLMPVGVPIEVRLRLRDPGTHISGFLLDFF